MITKAGGGYVWDMLEEEDLLLIRGGLARQDPSYNSPARARLNALKQELDPIILEMVRKRNIGLEGAR